MSCFFEVKPMKQPDSIDVRQLAAGYLDCAMWAEALAADAARVVALLARRELPASELRQFGANLRESAGKLRLHVSHAETAVQRTKGAGRGNA